MAGNFKKIRNILLTGLTEGDKIVAMTKMSKERMKEYQRERRARIRGGESVATVSGVLALVRGLEERVGRLEELNGVESGEIDYEVA